MVQLIKGFKDILPGKIEKWQYIEKTAAAVLTDFGFHEIRPPIMEKTALFARSIGESTDIVEKEMYTFPDRKGDLVTLRPEATAGVVRAYLQHKMYAVDPVRKLYTIGPMFRRERPQKGRYRQFYQINAEVFAIESAFIDAQLIFLLTTLLKRLNVTAVSAHINSLGCPKCRPQFRLALSDYITQHAKTLCSDCRRRSDLNPLRVLDCKVSACREAMDFAPALQDYLCGECEQHFKQVIASLKEMQVPFELDKRLVRGLDYYSRTTFEIHSNALGAQSAVAGGGRYDSLMKLLGGPDLPAIGFAIGLDRLVEIVSLEPDKLQKRPDIFIAAMGNASQKKSFGWVNTLSCSGVRAEMDYSDKSLKSQMKRAHRLEAGWVLIVGERELESGSAVLRNMTTKVQEEVPLENITREIKSRI